MVTSADWLPLAVLSHVSVVCGVLAFALLVKLESWLSPITLFLALLELFTRCCRFAHCTRSRSRSMSPITCRRSSPVLAPSVWLGVLVFATCLSPNASRPRSALTFRPDASLYAPTFVVGGVSRGLFALLARDVGVILPFVLLGYGGAAEMFGRGYLAAGFP